MQSSRNKLTRGPIHSRTVQRCDSGIPLIQKPPENLAQHTLTHGPVLLGRVVPFISRQYRRVAAGLISIALKQFRSSSIQEGHVPQ